MAINNINTIQNPDDLEFIKQASNEYILQSLANLGQRIGLTGDGVKISDFTFSDIVNGTNYNAHDYIGHIEKKFNEIKKQDVITIGIRRKDNLDDTKTIPTDIEINDINGWITVTEGDITLEQEINGIETYRNGKIIASEGYYTSSFVGITNDVIQEYTCEKFDKIKNVICSGIRIVPSYDDKHNYKGVALFYIYLDPNSEYGDTYKFELWYRNNIRPEFTFDNILDYIDELNIAGLSPEYIWGDAVIRDLFTNQVTISDIHYSVETNTFIFDEGSIPPTFANLRHYVQFYVYDLTYLYRFTKEYYSEIVYKNNNLQFKRQIFAHLFNMILENSTTATEAWVPLDFKINYACNDGNEWQIYYSTQDLITKYIPKEITSDILLELSENSSILCYTDKQERATLYNFSVDYDPENSTTVYSVNVYKHYTLPYINKDGYWVLNDIDSNIYAKGRDAGNPNIIIIESHEDSHTVVSGANKHDILNQIGWEKRSAYIQPLESINLNDLKVQTKFDWIKVNYWVPSISSISEKKLDEWVNLLENSLIINIADIQCVDYTSNINYTPSDIVERYGEYGVITTMWVLSDEVDGDGRRYYDYLRRQDNYACAADFNYITNMNNLINWTISNYEPKHPDKYHFTYLTFDASYVTLKNNTTETRTYIYPNVVNRESTDYNAFNYDNNFNLTPKYNDIVEGGEDNNITNIQQSGDRRYLNTTYNSGINVLANVVTNTLYSYTVNKSKYNYEEYIPNYNVPSIDLGEVLTRNQTLLNRLNVLSFDKYGTAYMSYVGTSYNLSKHKFVVGTTNTNINMGTDTLINASERSTFIPQTEFDINFDTTYVNGNAYIQKDITVEGNIINYGQQWTRYDSVLSDSHVVTYFSTSIVPTGRYIYEMKDNFTTNEGEYNGGKNESFAGILNLNRDGSHTNFHYLWSNVVREYAEGKDGLYVICTLPEYYEDGDGNYKGIHSIYNGDGLYIPELLHKLKLDSWIKKDEELQTVDTTYVNVTSRNMKIYKYNGMQLVLQSSSMLLYPDMYKYTVNEVSDEYYYGQEIGNYTYSTFKGNELNITYYVADNKLNIQIDECAADSVMSYVNKIITEYKNYLTD